MHALRKTGRHCGKNRIARLMRSRGLRARQKRRFRPKTTQSDHKLPVAPNWLRKIPKPEGPGEVWLGDITYIQTQEGWLYLSVSWTIAHDVVSAGMLISHWKLRW